MSKVIVYHRDHGCDCGCCGHVVELDGVTHYEFSHPDIQEPIDYARDLVRLYFGEEHVADLDWDNCVIGEW